MPGVTAMSGPLDAVIIRAGFAGIAMVHKLNEHGFSVHGFEAGDGPGGTWYRNRCLAYPRLRGVESIEVTPEAAAAWARHVEDVAHLTLYPKAESWFAGASIPGKRRMSRTCRYAPVAAASLSGS